MTNQSEAPTTDWMDTKYSLDVVMEPGLVAVASEGRSRHSRYHVWDTRPAVPELVYLRCPTFADVCNRCH